MSGAIPPNLSLLSLEDCHLGVVPWLRRPVAGLSLRSSGCDLRPDRVGAATLTRSVVKQLDFVKIGAVKAIVHL